MPRIYLDHAATTALSPAALDEMLPLFTQEFGNPSSIYDYGQEAHKALERARRRVASCIGALPTEVYFTGGGTESDNWVLRGLCKAHGVAGSHVITTSMEHNAVLRTLEELEEQGLQVTRLSPNRQGHISPAQLEEAIQPNTILISIMLANNVVGTVVDVAPLAQVARAHRVPFHTDAVQAAGHIPVNVRALGVDYLSLSAHKFNGPKGVGVLFCKLGKAPKALITGGGQERTARSGTENVPGIVGMAAALEENVAALELRAEHQRQLAERFNAGMLELPGVHVSGDPDPAHRLPGFCSYVLEGVSHSVLITSELAKRGVGVSSGSACSASSKEASHVLLALGYDQALASSSLRVTIGHENTADEIDYALAQIEDVLARVRGDNFAKAPRLRSDWKG